MLMMFSNEEPVMYEYAYSHKALKFQCFPICLPSLWVDLVEAKDLEFNKIDV